MFEKLKIWWQKKQEEKEMLKQLLEYYDMLNKCLPLWKHLGFPNKKEWDNYTMILFQEEVDNEYMVTKCPDDSWVVWIDLAGSWISYIAFATWEETVQFLYEEHQKYGDEWEPEWGPELFFLDADQDPFYHEPNFEAHRRSWKGLD